MSDTAQPTAGPNWDRLYEIAAAQEGHFTTIQAADAGYSPQLLAKYLKRARVIRVRRGVYRLVHFPAGEHEDLIAVWLWTERSGVFSHETALALHELSDALPSRVHVTVPAAWEDRRLRTPKRVVLHFADLAKSEQTWVGTVRVTTVARTLRDCAQAKSAPDLVRAAFEEAAKRGLMSRASEPSVISYLRRFFSVSSGRSGPRFRSSAGSTLRRQ